MFTTLAAILAFAQAPAVTADTIIMQAKIWTGDAANPEAAALAIKDGKILAIGTQEAIQKLAGPNTKTIELRGQRVVPGFHDSHVHLLGGGRSLAQVDLKDAKDEAEFGRRLKAEFDDKAPKTRWLLGGNWDHDRTFHGVLPTAAMLDKYVSDRPVYISRYDGHMAVANSAALKIAGITAATKDVAGGVIFRDADNKPTGVLKDNAMALVEKHVPEPDAAEIHEAMDAAFKAFAAAGITSVNDMEGSSAATLAKYREALLDLDRPGKLTVRIGVHLPIANEDGKPGPARYRSEFLHFNGVKGFMDGSLGSSTAKMYEAYASDSKSYGVFVTDPKVMRNYLTKAVANVRIIGVHAIGDEANGALLDLYAELTASNPREYRFRIEHAQHLRPIDYPRFKLLNVVASMQPYHVIDDGRWAEGRIGATRCESSYAYRSLLDQGATLAFGSDWPVAPLDVLAGLDAAVNRRPLDGKHPNGWFPAQRITVAEAMTAYTLGSAFAAMEERSRGSLAVGKYADLVVLSDDIFDDKVKDKLKEVKVQMTMVDGKVVFQKP